MKNLEFTKDHFDQMLRNEEDYKKLSFDEVKESFERGAEIVDKNKGFANLDTKLEEAQMLDVAAFINFRLAKEDLGEYVEEINN